MLLVVVELRARHRCSQTWHCVTRVDRRQFASRFQPLAFIFSGEGLPPRRTDAGPTSRSPRRRMRADARRLFPGVHEATAAPIADTVLASALARGSGGTGRGRRHHAAWLQGVHGVRRLRGRCRRRLVRSDDSPFGPGRIPEDLLGEIEAGRGEVSSRKLPGATGSRLDAHAQHADERLAPGFLVAARAALPLPRRRWRAPLPDEAAAAWLVVAGAHARRAPGQARHPRPATPGPRAALPRGVRSSRRAAQPCRPGTPRAAGGAPASRTGLG